MSWTDEVVVLTSGLKLPYALAQQLIKITFVLILQVCGGVLGLLFSDGRYAYFTMEESLCCKLLQNKVVQFVTVPPLNALCLLLRFLREQLTFLFMWTFVCQVIWEMIFLNAKRHFCVGYLKIHGSWSAWILWSFQTRPTDAPHNVEWEQRSLHSLRWDLKLCIC